MTVYEERQLDWDILPRTGLRVLRLCSVFEPDDAQLARPDFDPIGGMQNHTASLTRALDARGVSQVVVTSRLGGASTTRSLGRAATVHRVGLPIRRLRQFWAADAWRYAMRSAPVDLVHVHQGEDLAALPLGAAVAAHLRCPLVVTLHCSVQHSVPCSGARLTALRIVGGALEQRMLRRADAVITLVDTAAAQLGPGHRVVVIPSGVEPAIFRTAAPSPLLADIPGPRILYLGRLARQKDVATLVAAFALLRCPASLVIVGDGPERRVLDGHLATLPESVRRRVYRFGFRPHHEVPALLAGADVMALPSVYEEMGSVLVEAMHAGVPAVASDVGGIPDVVADGRTGRLVPPGDPVRWAAALDELLASPRLLDDMRAECLQRSAAYSWDVLSGRVLDLYTDVVAASRWSTSSRAATSAML
jgi:glycogen synthase